MVIWRKYCSENCDIVFSDLEHCDRNCDLKTQKTLENIYFKVITKRYFSSPITSIYATVQEREKDSEMLQMLSRNFYRNVFFSSQWIYYIHMLP